MLIFLSDTVSELVIGKYKVRFRVTRTNIFFRVSMEKKASLKQLSLSDAILILPSYNFQLARLLRDYPLSSFLFFSELETKAQLLEKDLYYYKKTSRDLKKKLREKMASGMGTSMESDVVVTSGDLEAQYRSSDAHGRELANEVSRMKVAWSVPKISF